jgi:quercetin dioxygenase-like cupin family protein
MQADSRTLDGFPMGGFTLRPFGGDELMVVRVDGPAGSLAAAHAHPHEQMCVIVEGRVRFRIGDEETEAGPGDVLHIPSGVEHEAEVLEDTVFFDVFHPIRADFLEKIAASR